MSALEALLEVSNETRRVGLDILIAMLDSMKGGLKGTRSVTAAGE